MDNNLSSVFSSLRQAGVGFACITFSGGGDDGDIDAIDLFPTYESYLTSTQAIDNRELETVIRDFASNLLNNYDLPDWYNNEGGCGNIELIVSPNGPEHDEIKVEVHVNVVTQETTHLRFDPRTMRVL